MQSKLIKKYQMTEERHPWTEPEHGQPKTLDTLYIIRSVMVRIIKNFEHEGTNKFA